jgi:hypothetical protein
MMTIFWIGCAIAAIATIASLIADYRDYRASRPVEKPEWVDRRRR